MPRIDRNSFDGSLMTRGAFFRRARVQAVQDEIAASAQAYVDPATGRVFAHLAEHRACAVCDADRPRPLFRKNGFAHVQCEACGFVYVDPILAEAPLSDYYRQQANAWTDVTTSSEYTRFQDLYYRYHLETLDELVRTPNRALLDIGCNAGEFLLAARAHGWTTLGHELNARAVARARAAGLEVFEEPWDRALFGARRFGAVSLLGVLEHLPRPLDALRDVHGLLEPGGVLAVIVPNADGLATRMLQEKCNTFDGIEHLNFWGVATLERFLARAGFTVLRTETAISELYTLNNYLHYESYPYATLAEYPLLLDGLLTPEEIHARKLGHHRLAYATPA